MLKLTDKDPETAIIYGTKQEVYDSMTSFMESGSLIMTTVYDNQPAIVVRKQTPTQE